VRQELAECNAVLEDITGAAVKFFRPPFGARRPYVLRAARELGLTPVMWNVTGYDWNPIGVDGILANLDEGIARNRRRGSVGRTCCCTMAVIARWARRGWTR
jgi:peptidoglycan/xylan/chitin deacetylase (PgdA/CDA1 family)